MSKLESITYFIADKLNVDIHSRREKSTSLARVALMERGAYQALNLQAERFSKGGNEVSDTFETLYSDGSVCLDLRWRAEGENEDKGIKVLAFQNTDMNVVFSEDGGWRDVLNIHQEEFDNKGFAYGLEVIPTLEISEMLLIAEKFAKPFKSSA